MTLTREGQSREKGRRETYTNSGVESLLLLVVLVGVDGVESNLVVGELGSDLEER